MSHENQRSLLREKLTERRPARDEEVKKYVVHLLHFNHISCFTEGGLLLYIMSGEQRGNSTRECQESARGRMCGVCMSPKHLCTYAALEFHSRHLQD